MYTIQAIITDLEKSSIIDGLNIEWVQMPLNKIMIPLMEDSIHDYEIPFLPLTDDGEDYLPEELSSLCEQLSKDTQLIYIEAEIFGGDGIQACVKFSNSFQIGDTIIDQSAINIGLSFLGIERTNEHDEFDTMELGKHRDTAQWIKNNN